MPKQIVTARIEEIIERGRPRIRWTDEAEEDLKIMGIRNWHTLVTDRKEWRRNLWEAKVHDGLQCLGRRRSREIREEEEKKEKEKEEEQKFQMG